MTTFTILYKSGAKVRVKAEGLKVTRKGSTVESVSWNKMSPYPFTLGVDEIAAIYEGKA